MNGTVFNKFNIIVHVVAVRCLHPKIQGKTSEMSGAEKWSASFLNVFVVTVQNTFGGGLDLHCDSSVVLIEALRVQLQISQIFPCLLLCPSFSMVHGARKL